MDRLEVLDVLRRTEQYFRRADIGTSRLDAEVLLAHVLHVPRIQLYAGFDRPLTLDELDRYRVLVRRRADREPVAYLVGTKEFHSLEFEVGPAVLIPRPETEHLVDAAVGISRSRERPTLLDVGTGSGAIAVSFAVEVPEGSFVATDRSEEALAVAKRNAERLGVADRGTFLAGDLYEPLAGRSPFDIVVSNPPYVVRGEEVDPECAHEPEEALFVDGDPMTLYRRLAAGAPALLAPDGRFILELSDNREAEIHGVVEEHLRVERVIRDFQGLARVLVASRY